MADASHPADELSLDGGAALAVIQNRLTMSSAHDHYLRERFYRPVPRLAEATLLQGMASAALDISDGLAADLNHICEASDLGARNMVIQ
ncbi:MAG: hypothetical protein EOO68_38810 [Moraxellaceae bacterium]|nr:MAG: hypothetical protein EOO68_38810 [Moraxellaceae bacterium]